VGGLCQTSGTSRSSVLWIGSPGRMRRTDGRLQGVAPPASAGRVRRDRRAARPAGRADGGGLVPHPGGGRLTDRDAERGRPGPVVTRAAGRRGLAGRADARLRRARRPRPVGCRVMLAALLVVAAAATSRAPDAASTMVVVAFAAGLGSLALGLPEVRRLRGFRRLAVPPGPPVPTLVISWRGERCLVGGRGSRLRAQARPVAGTGRRGSRPPPRVGRGRPGGAGGDGRSGLVREGVAVRRRRSGRCPPPGRSTPPG